MERKRNGNPETHAVIVKRLWPYTLFLILVCIFLWKPIFRGDALLPGDYLAQMSPWNTVVKPSDPSPQWNPLQWDAIAQFYPWRVFYARSMAAGHIPLWNPHQFRGTPFLANGQSAVLYPLNAVFLLFDPITAFTVFAALHLFLAQVFMYWLLRELGCKELGGVVGAICFAFSAFMVLWLELPTFVGVAVWLPLVLLLIHRSVEGKSPAYGMFAGAALALSFLAGHLQIAFYVTLASLLWWVWRLAGVWKAEGGVVALKRVAPSIAAFVIVAGLIGSAQLLPTFELGANSPRSGGPTAAGYDWFIGNSLKPYRLVTAFSPDFYGNPSKNNYYLIGMMDGHAGSAADYMEYGMYVGILPLILAGIALGTVRKQRHVGYFGVLAVLALLSARGTIVNAPFYYLIPGFSAFGGPNRILLLYMFGAAALAGFGMDALLEMIGRSRRPKWLSRQAVGILAVAIIIADLFAFGIDYNPTCSRDKVYPRTQLTDTLKRIAGNSRIAPINPKWSLWETPKAILPPNAAMVYGLYDVQGYDSLYTKTYKDLLSSIQGVDSSPPENGNMVLMRRYAPDIRLFADWIVMGEPFSDSDPQRLVPLERVDGLYIYTNERAVITANVSSNPDVLRVMWAFHSSLNYVGPNQVMAACSRYYYGPLGAGTVNYPGWVARSGAKRLDIDYGLPVLQTKAWVQGPFSALFSFVPFSFRLGLFLSLVGIALLSATGACCLVRGKGGE